MLSRASNTHPNLTQIWLRYLDQSVEAAEIRAFECISAAERMNADVNDYGADILAAAYVAYTTPP